MRIQGIIAATCLAALAMPAAAQDATVRTEPRSTFSVAITGGSLGVGPEVGFRVSDHFGIRGNASFLNLSGTANSDDTDYNARLKLKSYGAMIDVYPFGGSFRISGGARINHNRGELDAQMGGDSTIEVGGETYTAAEVGVLSGRARVKKFAPALTLGWSGKNRRGFMLGFEIGALFQGAVQIDEFTATGTARNDATFRARLADERRDLQQDIDKYKVYPIVMSSIGWRF